MLSCCKSCGTTVFGWSYSTNSELLAMMTGLEVSLWRSRTKSRPYFVRTRSSWVDPDRPVRCRRRLVVLYHSGRRTDGRRHTYTLLCYKEISYSSFPLLLKIMYNGCLARFSDLKSFIGDFALSCFYYVLQPPPLLFVVWSHSVGLFCENLWKQKLLAFFHHHLWVLITLHNDDGIEMGTYFRTYKPLNIAMLQRRSIFNLFEFIAFHQKSKHQLCAYHLRS